MANFISASKVAQGFAIRHTLRGHDDFVTRVAWSPDGRTLASGAEDGTICLWEPDNGHRMAIHRPGRGMICDLVWSPDGGSIVAGLSDCTIHRINVRPGQDPSPIIACRGRLDSSDESDAVFCFARSPDGRHFASGTGDSIIRIWDASSGRPSKPIIGHNARVSCLTWSQDGRFLISGSEDTTIWVWDFKTGRPVWKLENHHHSVLNLISIPEVEWAPEHQTLVSSSFDGSVIFWNLESGREFNRIEGNRSAVEGLSFSRNHRFLAMKSDSVIVWDCLQMGHAAVLHEPAFTWRWRSGLAFNPMNDAIASFGTEGKTLRIWDIDLTDAGDPGLLNRYSNAKVVLVGDSGAGKTGLALALADHPFRRTESSLRPCVLPFEHEEVRAEDQRMETRETLLWDLAGHAENRLLHLLHLNQMSVALLVFDPRNDLDPLAGIYRWDRELRQARAASESTSPLRKLLVSAKSDLPGTPIDRGSIDAAVKALHFDGYIDVSAKEGWNVEELKSLIRDAIDWDCLPKVNSASVFHRVRDFLVGEKEEGRILASSGELFLSLSRSPKAPRNEKGLKAEFEKCLSLLDSIGLVRRLNFGNLVLLQPDLLHSYASAMIAAARREPSGLVCLSEDQARQGKFPIPETEQVVDKNQEQLLLIATIADLIRHEIALRGHSNDGTQLVFPGHISRERLDGEGPALGSGEASQPTKILGFEGATMNVYATLAVRLHYSGIFRLKQIWRQAAVYDTSAGGLCEIALRSKDDMRGELVLSFDKSTSPTTQIYFEAFILKHLKEWSMPGAIRDNRIIRCKACDCEVLEDMIHRSGGRANWPIYCPQCGNMLVQLDSASLPAVPAMPVVTEMVRNVDERRDIEVAASTLSGKELTRDYDVFLCHSNKDKDAVRAIGLQLKKRGLLPWLDEWELIPGTQFEPKIMEMIERGRAVAVFIGEDGVRGWAGKEKDAFIEQFAKRQCAVIPVILPACTGDPRMPANLAGFTWVDFRLENPDPLNQLICGITGRKPMTDDVVEGPAPTG